MSKTMIDDLIFKLQLAAIKSGEESRKAERAIEDIGWYILTGRASSDYIQALSRCRPACLIRRLIPVWGCRDDVIATSKAYLKAE